MIVAMQYSKPDLWPLEPGPMGWKLLRRGDMTLLPMKNRPVDGPSPERRFTNWIYLDIPETHRAVRRFILEALPGPISEHIWLHVRGPRRFWTIYEEIEFYFSRDIPGPKECTIEDIAVPEGEKLFPLEGLAEPELYVGNLLQALGTFFKQTLRWR
ncbi:hypothetical protein H1S01_16940 [Heliobacterium chlorum]|uniref:Uncharacterized protein n=1 Tax=Heliobacterium chlorum TaxID=2698 RepID=A0ABR7T5V0_HELCL|nr:hypothetical protein [Heliobacterium chlorum]MBC9786153.1 hypothetical protein [Heliobacterium chlorum]